MQLVNDKENCVDCVGNGSQGFLSRTTDCSE